MSTKAKIGTWVVAAVVVVAGGAWWWMSMSQTAVAPVNSNHPFPETQTQPMQPTPTTPTSNNGVSMTDDSNAGLQTDLSNIDSQMNGFASDNASVNQGMNDQPVQQAQL